MCAQRMRSVTRSTAEWKSEVLRRSLRFQVAQRNAVVAVELNVIEGCGNAVPAGHGRRFRPAYVRHGGCNHISKAHGLADQNDLQLDRSADGELLGAEKIDAGGTDVTGDECDG